MFLGLVSVGSVFAAGAFSGVEMSLEVWMLSALLAWCGAPVLAAFGLFMGYLLPSENVMQFISPLLAVFALVGGLFVPLALLRSAVQTLDPYTPTYSVAAIARSPLLGPGIHSMWLVNVVVWTAIFVAGATMLFRRDTQRS